MQLVRQSDEKDQAASSKASTGACLRWGSASGDDREVFDADFIANYDLLKIFIAHSIKPDTGIPVLSDFRVSCHSCYRACSLQAWEHDWSS